MTYRDVKNETSLGGSTNVITRDFLETFRETVEEDSAGAQKTEGSGLGSATMPDQGGFISIDLTEPIISDPTFGTACGAGDWVCGTGVTIVSNETIFTAVADAAGQVSTKVLVSGETYRITIIVDTLSSGELTVSAGGVTQTAIDATGTFTYNFTASATTAPKVVASSGPSTGVISSFACVEVI